MDIYNAGRSPVDIGMTGKVVLLKSGITTPVADKDWNAFKETGLGKDLVAKEILFEGGRPRGVVVDVSRDKIIASLKLGDIPEALKQEVIAEHAAKAEAEAEAEAEADDDLDDMDKQELIAMAKDLGLEVDGRSNEDKIKAAIREAMEA